MIEGINCAPTLNNQKTIPVIGKIKALKMAYHATKTDYQKRAKICEKLGALKFQKVVFKVENVKYKLLRKFCPNFIKYYDKWSDKKRDRQLKKYHAEDKKKEIIEFYKKQKLLVRKEINRGHNRNYHIDEHMPTNMFNYLEWNKEVHKRGVIKNLIVIPILGVGAAIGFPAAVPFLAMEVGSLFINFQCINIQNYNIYRLKDKEEQLRKIEERNLKRNQEKYREISTTISSHLDKTNDIPSIETIIGSIKTKEELVQLKNFIISECNQRYNIAQENSKERGQKND